MVLVCIKANIFFGSIFLLVASVKSYAKSPKAFALVFLQTVHQCLTFNYCYYEIPSASKIAAVSDLLSQGRSFLPASAIKRGVFEN